MRKAILVLIVLVVATVSLWFFSRRKSVHRLTLHAYYGHVQHVQKGMPVCVDGVQVGSVAGVTVRPELGDRPVEVILNITTPYDLRIPSGSAAEVVEPGVFRATVVDIDTRGTSVRPWPTVRRSRDGNLQTTTQHMRLGLL